jgi:hypothetical protein
MERDDRHNTMERIKEVRLQRIELVNMRGLVDRFRVAINDKHLRQQSDSHQYRSTVLKLSEQVEDAIQSFKTKQRAAYQSLLDQERTLSSDLSMLLTRFEAWDKQSSQSLNHAAHGILSPSQFLLSLSNTYG